MPPALIEKARSLLAAGQQQEAKGLLLEAASGPDGSADVRRAYVGIFLLTPAQKQWIEGTLSKLAASDATARAKAAKELCRAAAREYSIQNQELIGDPRALDYIVPALESKDEKVAECSVIAVAQGAVFYYRDWRAWQPVLKLLRAKKPNTRRWAVQAAAYLGREEALGHILPLAADAAQYVRDEVSRMLVWLIRQNLLTPGARGGILNEMLPRLDSKNPADRQSVATVLRFLNDAAALEAIRKALKRETDRETRKRMEHTIRCLEAGDPALPM